MHLNRKFLKVDFLKTVEAKVIIITRYVQPNGTMAINKSQRSSLTFDLSFEFTHFGSPINILKHSFLRNHLANQTQILMKTLFDTEAKIYTNCSGHMPKMANMPKYGKTPLKIFFSRTR